MICNLTADEMIKREIEDGLALISYKENDCDSEYLSYILNGLC